MLTDLDSSELEVWGFNGTPDVACGFSLPIVRHKSTDRFAALALAGEGGSMWSPRSEIEEQLRLGRLSRLSPSCPLPKTVLPLSPANQPVVAWAQPSFWRLLGMTDDRDVDYYGQTIGWAKCQVEVAGPTRADTDPADSQPPELVAQPLWLARAPVADVERDLDEWARQYLNRYDDQLVVDRPNWSQLELLADQGLCAARAPDTRYRLYVRYCAAMYYRPSSESQAPASPERCSQVFRILVRNEFKGVSWDRFREDMAVVVLRSRDVLRFRFGVPSTTSIGSPPTPPGGGAGVSPFRSEMSVEGSGTRETAEPAVQTAKPSASQAGH